mgnify:CR=1 FL=1
MMKKVEEQDLTGNWVGYFRLKPSEKLLFTNKLEAGEVLARNYMRPFLICVHV